MKKEELFTLFSNELKFPSYFGNNWDALYDLLLDLNWINQKKIVIIHEDVPFSNMEIERKKYLELLLAVAKAWHNDEIHELRINFPKQYQKEIEKILYPDNLNRAF
ncbi:MAG: barstar family protein [Anaerolineae bacterium]